MDTHVVYHFEGYILTTYRLPWPQMYGGILVLQKIILAFALAIWYFRSIFTLPLHFGLFPIFVNICCHRMNINVKVKVDYNLGG